VNKIASENYWIREGAEGSDIEPTAAYANVRSFWLVKEELIDAIRAAGFGIVY